MITAGILAAGLMLAVAGLRPTQAAPVFENNLCGVSVDQVMVYMDRNGYSVVSVYPYIGCDYLVDTQYEHHTIVHVAGGKITGYEDLR